MSKYPDAKVISLGIGDTTEPIPEVITSAMALVMPFFHHGFFLYMHFFVVDYVTNSIFIFS